MRISKVSIIGLIAKGTPIIILISLFVGLAYLIPSDTDLNDISKKECIGFWKENGKVNIFTCNYGQVNLSKAYTVKDLQEELYKQEISNNFYCWPGGCLNLLHISKVCLSGYNRLEITINSSCGSESEATSVYIPVSKYQDLINKISDFEGRIIIYDC